MDEIFEELLKFSHEILELQGQITDDRIIEFEKTYDVTIPDDFKTFISRFNGLNMMGTEVYGFHKDHPESIENIYAYEHFQVAVPQYKNLVPFSPDGRGNFYCLCADKQSHKFGAVLFWVSNYQYSKNDSPEIVNRNFTEWIKQVVIDWTLEDYNYDGTEK
jgi:hypothetical protein